MSWLMTGEDSVKAAEAEKAAAEKRRAEQGKAFRFFIAESPKGSGNYPDAEVIFVDGAINPKTGALAPPRFYEHSILHNNQWTQFVCPKQTLPKTEKDCPFCEAKDKASLVSLFTVIDLRPYTTKEGKVIPFTRKLFVAKQTTFETLNKLGVKRGGIAGWRVSIGRSNGKAAAVGDVFDFQEKIADIAAARAKFTTTFKYKDAAQGGKEVTKTVCFMDPLDYDKEIVFRSGEDLRKMGFGSPASSMNAGPEVTTETTTSGTAEGTPEQYEGQV